MDVFGYVQNPGEFLQAHAYFPGLLALSYENKQFEHIFLYIWFFSLFLLPATAGFRSEQSWALAEWKKRESFNLYSAEMGLRHNRGKRENQGQ